MRKALIITYYWPPSGGAGVQRWLKFVKYFREFGWEPVVYTPENPESPDSDPSLIADIPDGTVVVKRPIWEPYLLYKRFLGQKKEEKIQAAFLSEKKKNPVAENISVWIRGNLFIPDARRYFITPSVRFLVKYLEQNPVDIVVSTGPPHSMHMIAREVSRRMSLPWLADFRDAWTGIDFYSDLRLTRWADSRHRSMELQVLRDADVVTVISPSMAEEFRAIYNREYKVITNGYDETDLLSAEAVHPDSKFSLVHAGTLSPSRNPEVLWKALKELVETGQLPGADLEIKLVGKVDHAVISSIEACGLRQFLTRVEYLPHQELVQVQKASQVLLLLINNTPNAKSILTGKLFEYLASGRPVICIGPVDGDAATILSQTHAGITVGYEDSAGLKRSLLRSYEQFKRGDLLASSTETEKYSRKNLTSAIACLMDAVVESHTGTR